MTREYGFNIKFCFHFKEYFQNIPIPDFSTPTDLSVVRDEVPHHSFSLFPTPRKFPSINHLPKKQTNGNFSDIKLDQALCFSPKEIMRN